MIFHILTYARAAHSVPVRLLPSMMPRTAGLRPACCCMLHFLGLVYLLTWLIFFTLKIYYITSKYKKHFTRYIAHLKLPSKQASLK